MDRVPTLEDFASRRVTRPDASEIVRQRLYDYQLYPAAGVPQLTFFSQPAGQGITTSLGAVVGSSKTPFDTNLELPNQLPSGKQFMIESIEAFFFPGNVSTANTYTPAAVGRFAVAAAASELAQINDVNTFYQSGMFELNILSKNYLRETPMIAFPPKTGLYIDSSISTNSATVGAAAVVSGRNSGRAYYLEPEISLQPAVNFEALIRYPAAVPMPSGFNGRVGIIFDGFFARASQ